MTRYPTIAIALLLISCDRQRGPAPIDNQATERQAAEQQAEAKEAGAKEAREAVQRTRIDTLESRVSRLEAEIASIEARRGVADDINSSLARLNAQQTAPMPQTVPGKSPAPKADSATGSADKP